MDLDKCPKCNGDLIPFEYWDWDQSPQCSGQKEGRYCGAHTSKERVDWAFAQRQLKKGNEDA